LENALQKIEPYKNIDIKYPILSLDNAIFFNNLDFDPTCIKRETLEKK
jgi:hypothetical protein